MIGIYQDDFKDYLQDNLGYIKETPKNIITKCPWCEYNKEKDHYHLYIALDAPIFHCFYAGCEQSGILKKLITKIEGHDISSSFIDKEKLEKFKKKRDIFVDKDEKLREVILPDLKPYKYPNKELYIKKRLKFANIPLNSIDGLIFDVFEFIKVNHIPVDESLFRIQDYLERNFVGFLTNHGTTAIFRNIDHSQSMKFYKLQIQFSTFLDFYRLPGSDPKSKKIVLAEGIFDIFSEQIFDRLNIKNDVKLYASSLSSRYASLIHSIIFYEQVFKPDVVILSDNGIGLEYYKKMKKYNSHIFNTFTVYYNKAGKDFNDTPLIPVKEVI
ncbi:MAG: hypothetical protein ACFFG0_01435 [Candidatus Thorarchaeota archaeon]